ncbi:tRNA (N6-threonylcarbamoyladenosine(37)-N6)-methyltransferase TrmO [Pseudomonadota bacterium]
MHYSFEPIGIIHSPFREKFGIPRQPLLVPEAKARLELLAPYARVEALMGLENFSHLWVTFVFHQAMRGKWQPMVRPPRLGGNQRVGVFASRSPFRPNPIGLSVVGLESINIANGKAELNLYGVDLLDGTPVLDIKPYIPYVDSIPNAQAGYATAPPDVCLEVAFSAQAEGQLSGRSDGAELKRLIVGLLQMDPRPAYMEDADPDRIYGMQLYDFDLQWRVCGNAVEVLGLQ